MMKWYIVASISQTDIVREQIEQQITEPQTPLAILKGAGGETPTMEICLYRAWICRGLTFQVHTRKGLSLPSVVLLLLI